VSPLEKVEVVTFSTLQGQLSPASTKCGRKEVEGGHLVDEGPFIQALPKTNTVPPSWKLFNQNDF